MSHAKSPEAPAQAIGRFLRRFDGRGSGMRLRGMCDAAEARHFGKGVGGRLLVLALDIDCVPRPLDALLASMD